jgi:hypothetical protein
MDVCVRVYSVFVFSRVQVAALKTVWSLVQGVLPSV